MRHSILFEELSSDPEEFLHELSDPDLVRSPRLSPAAVRELRRRQIERLERNIALLRRKQAEFNARMEEYIANLNALIASLRRGAQNAGRGVTAAAEPRTHVRCLQCRCERVFEKLEVVFARESDEEFSKPTECYVNELGRLKKGIFRCARCGSAALTIRAV